MAGEREAHRQDRRAGAAGPTRRGAVAAREQNQGEAQHRGAEAGGQRRAGAHAPDRRIEHAARGGVGKHAALGGDGQRGEADAERGGQPDSAPHPQRRFRHAGPEQGAPSGDRGDGVEGEPQHRQQPGPGLDGIVLPRRLRCGGADPERKCPGNRMAVGRDHAPTDQVDPRAERRRQRRLEFGAGRGQAGEGHLGPARGDHAEGERPYRLVEPEDHRGGGRREGGPIRGFRRQQGGVGRRRSGDAGSPYRQGEPQHCEQKHAEALGAHRLGAHRPACSVRAWA